jgi:hypothetical protein
MTETQWLAGADPRALLEFLVGRGDLSPRKHRLFAAACCRRAWPLLADPRSRAAVEVAERFADGAASREERVAALDGAGDATADVPGDGHLSYPAACAAEDLLPEPLAPFDSWCDLPGPGEGEADGALARAALVRDIYGNPFRPAGFDPRWRAADAVGLARATYDERAFDRLPLLADALMDAGCDSDEILAHCRSAEPHVRGCWVVDLVLGKE